MSETILVAVEDALLREFTTATLRLYGYTVMVASDAEGAAAMASRHQASIHLLITDINPGPNGTGINVLITRRHPNLRFLYLFGHKDEGARLRALGPRVGLLHKLFLPMSLARKVREILG